MSAYCEMVFCQNDGAVECVVDDGFGEYTEVLCWHHFLDPSAGNELRSWFQA